MKDLYTVKVDETNIKEYPPRCFLSPSNIGQKQKASWVKQRLKEGLIIKLLYTKKPEKLIGYIEYIPGKYAWRAVDAAGYLFIHCLWITPKKIREQGLGSQLIKECITDAKKQDFHGVAVVASNGSFMADTSIFEKNGFTTVEKSDPYHLLVNSFDDHQLPRFKNWRKKLESYNGLHIIYSDQCPWVARFMNENKKRFDELDVIITKLETAEDAQNAPSIYATFNLIFNGTLLSDHYISSRRFENIINKELN